MTYPLFFSGESTHGMTVKEMLDDVNHKRSIGINGVLSTTEEFGQLLNDFADPIWHNPTLGYNVNFEYRAAPTRRTGDDGVVYINPDDTIDIGNIDNPNRNGDVIQGVNFGLEGGAVDINGVQTTVMNWGDTEIQVAAQRDVEPVELNINVNMIMPGGAIVQMEDIGEAVGIVNQEGMTHLGNGQYRMDLSHVQMMGPDEPGGFLRRVE